MIGAEDFHSITPHSIIMYTINILISGGGGLKKHIEQGLLLPVS